MKPLVIAAVLVLLFLALALAGCASGAADYRNTDASHVWQEDNYGCMEAAYRRVNAWDTYGRVAEWRACMRERGWTYADGGKLP